MLDSTRESRKRRPAISLVTVISQPPPVTATSIDRDTFENASEAELGSLSVTDRVLAFLVANRDQAFEAREIARQIDVDQRAVGTALTRLKDRGLVEHKATYWAVTSDDERLRSHAAFERATALFNEQLGEESMEEWLEHAPDDDHPSTSVNE